MCGRHGCCRPLPATEVVWVAECVWQAPSADGAVGTSSGVVAAEETSNVRKIIFPSGVAAPCLHRAAATAPSVIACVWQAVGISAEAVGTSEDSSSEDGSSDGAAAALKASRVQVERKYLLFLRVCRPCSGLGGGISPKLLLACS